IAEQTIADAARRCLDAGRGLAALPGGPLVSQAASRSERSDSVRFGTRLRTQSVIDGGDNKLDRGVAPTPALRPNHQRSRIRATGDGEDDTAGSGEAGKERRNLAVGDRMVSTSSASVHGRRPA